MLHFDDGYATHHIRGQTRGSEFVTIAKLDVSKAMELMNYSIISSDHALYFTQTHPISIARKTKPTEFALLCQQYDNGCVNTDPDHALEHWVYLILPYAMTTGSHYKISLNGLAQQANEFDFVFNEQELHSEAIHVNNIAYTTKAPAKYAYLYHWMGDQGSVDFSSFNGSIFNLFDTDKNAFVYSGKINFRKSKTNSETTQASDSPGGNFSSADVYECDFSDFNTPGNYKVVIAGIGSSFGFEIKEDGYQEAFYWVMKGLYHNRSGIELNTPYAQFHRPAPHHPKLTPGFSQKLKYSTFRSFDLSTYDGSADDKLKIENGFKGNLENTFGWYQDAGDWDGYYTHTSIPAYLLFLFESGKDKFNDGELNIPESGNGLPDVLDEASWLLRYFQRAKEEIKQKGWGTGGIPGSRVFGDLWGSDAPGDVGQGSWEDVQRDWYVLGEDPWTSYKYAACSAQLAYILQGLQRTDPGGIDWKQEAISAYEWAELNASSQDKQRKDFDLNDNRLYAAAALYRLTGESKYHSAAIPIIDKVTSIDMGRLDQMFGIWMYLLSGNQVRDSKTLNHVKELVTISAEKYLSASAEKRAARWGGDFSFPMLVGQGSTPMVTPGVFGFLANKQNQVLSKKYLTYLHTTADYFLGCNPLNITWISGVGERYPKGIFHLDWWYYDKSDPTNREPVIKGVVPYGPWRYEDLGALGWWNPNWAYSDKSGTPRIYPTNPTEWPGHERWFDMRVSPLSSEFTIHQNTVVAAFVYGFLTAGKTLDLEEGVVTDVIGENKSEHALVIVPNPASSSLRIKIDSNAQICHVELLTLEGKTMQKNSYNRAREVVLDTSTFSCGIYLVNIVLSNGNKEHARIMICN